MDALAELLHQHFATAAPEGLVAAYLFGSHAEGRAHADSDIDVAILLDRDGFRRPDQRWEAQERIAGEIIAATHQNRVDVVLLNDAPPELARAAVTRGTRVFCADAEATHAFVRSALSRAADLDPWLARMRRVKLEALRR